MLATLKRLIAKTRSAFSSTASDFDFEEELQSHIAMLEEENVRRGMSCEEARRAALLKIGGLAQLRESHRETRGLPQFDSFLRDIRYALRALRKHAGFTTIAVITLAIGIGVNTATFTAWNAVALRPIQAPEPKRLVQLTRTTRDQMFSYPDYAYYRDNNRTFSGLVAINFQGLSLSGVTTGPSPATGGIVGAAGFQFPHLLAGTSEVLAATISGNYFKVLGVNAILGRTFLPEEDGPGGPAAVMVSYNFWEKQFARNPSVLTRNLTLNGVGVAVVGITPPDFLGTSPTVPDFWVPFALQSRLASEENALHDRNSICCRVFGRLKGGVSQVQAEANLNALRGNLQVAFPETKQRPGRQAGSFVVVQASPFGPTDSGTTAVAILILAAVSLVLLIACANVASLLLARSAARQREIAIRLAIGASRRRLIRQLLTESGVIGLVAGAAGVVFSWWALRFLMLQIAPSIPFGNLALHLAPDRRVLAYMLFLSIGATFLFGLAPALEASKPNLSSALKDDGAAFGGRLRKSRLRDLMVGTQVAVCFILLIAAGLLARASQRALEVDLGFNYHNIVMLNIFSPSGTSAAVKAARSRLAQQFGSLPEIESVAGASRVPLAGGIRAVGVVPNGGDPNDPGAGTSLFNLVTPNYFQTMGIRILRGRAFNAQEVREDMNFDGSPVVVSEATARKFWPGQNPLGRRLSLGPGGDSIRFSGEVYPHSVSSLVVGIAKDVRSVGLDAVDDTCIYLPSDYSGGSLLIRARTDEAKTVASVQRVLAANHTGLEAIVGDSRTAFSNQTGFVLSRVGAIGSTIIGILGLLMASVGIYGTVGFAVAQRTQEIGIRMAMGAQRAQVLRLILYETMRPVAMGLMGGIAGSVIVSTLLRKLLFGLSPLDPATFLSVLLFLAAVALFAGYLPTKNATRTDPMVALRYE
ncbi:MAG TPA: ABC transporter permease [Bryobacteraceae bacterium]|nr:ABC transporter permease [Bryobacteraceae bacterium]